MNKQVAIAGLLGAIAAQAEPTPCDGPFVAEAQDALDALTDNKADLELKTAALEALAADELALFDTADGRVSAQTALMATFVAALSTASTNYTTQSDLKEAATDALVGIDALVASTGVDKGASQGIVDAQQGKIDDQQLICDKLDAAVLEHTAEKATMTTLKATADTNVDTAQATLQALIDAKDALIVLRDTAVVVGPPATVEGSGQAARKTTADTAYGTAAVVGPPAVLATGTILAYDTALADYTSNQGIYQAAKLALDKQAQLVTMLGAGCTFDDGTARVCTGQADDPIAAIYNDAVATRDGTLTATESGLQGANTAAVTLVATKWDEKQQALSEQVVRTAELTAFQLIINTKTERATKDNAGYAIAVAADATLPALTSGDTTEFGTHAANVILAGTANDNLVRVTGHYDQAVLDQGRGAALLGTLKAALVPLNEDLVVKTYLETVQVGLKAVQEAAKSAANENLSDLENLQTLAQATVDRAQLTFDFYDGLLTTATASKGQADGLVAANAGAILAAGVAIEGATANLAMAVSACKVAGYEEAQQNLDDQTSAKEANDALAAEVKVAYDAKAAFSTTGETNTICAYPAKAKDAAQEPRPVCAEGFCCGAAQKFLKDGTKLAIETCQTAEGVHTYTYFPPLVEGSPVEPTPETWRFQCISGAQKLIATATAALAASYMMA